MTANTLALMKRKSCAGSWRTRAAEYRSLLQVRKDQLLAVARTDADDELVRKLKHEVNVGPWLGCNRAIS
jgi:hypothetical protein